VGHADDLCAPEIFDYAHVLEESIDSQRDDSTGEAWLHGRLNYSLLRRRKGANR
jgi:hypothetical protein